MKKFIILITLIILVFFGYEVFSSIKDRKKIKTRVFSIEDKSTTCLSSTINVYSDNTYDVYKANYYNYELIKPIKKGKYNYDINKILDNIDNYNKSDGFNYLVTIDGKEYVVARGEENELTEFMDSIDGNSLLRCE